jgi:hypothetical protein
LNGTVRSPFVDGPPSGTRTLADGTAIDLAHVVSVANCGKSSCAAAEVAAVTPDRPWGANNPDWHLYAYGRMADLLPASAIDSKFYVVVMAGDDAAETDGKPLQDMNGVIGLRGEAFGPHGAHRSVEVTIARPDTAQAAVRVLSWREIR